MAGGQTGGTRSTFIDHQTGSAFAILLCFLSQHRFHFCLGTFDSRLLSRWAALLEGCATSQKDSLEAKGVGDATLPGGVFSREKGGAQEEGVRRQTAGGVGSLRERPTLRVDF